jgi:hypothetical protein
MLTEYERQRLKNIEANRKLLESLGLGVLCAAISPISAPVAKPKPKPKPKAKLAPRKRKAEEMDGGSDDGETKIARRDDKGGTAAGPRRRPSRRSAAKVDYNEDNLSGSRRKYLEKQKERAEEAAEDAAGYVGNKLGKRKHDPCVNQHLTYSLTLLSDILPQETIRFYPSRRGWSVVGN